MKALLTFVLCCALPVLGQAPQTPFDATARAEIDNCWREPYRSLSRCSGCILASFFGFRRKSGLHGRFRAVASRKPASNTTRLYLSAARAMTEIRPFVLVVDDERLIADTLALVLKNHGFETVACYSADDAITILKTFRPDFLITDVVLNQSSNGIDLAIAAQQLVPSCNVILISGNAATGDLLDKAGLSGYSFTCLAKPIHPTELLAQMNTSATAENPRRFPAA